MAFEAAALICTNLLLVCQRLDAFTKTPVVFPVTHLTFLTAVMDALAVAAPTHFLNHTFRTAPTLGRINIVLRDYYYLLGGSPLAFDAGGAGGAGGG